MPRNDYNTHGGLTPEPVDPNVNPYSRYAELAKLGRSLTPEEEANLNAYYDWKPPQRTGGFPIGGSIGPMPSSPMPRGGGALHMNESSIARRGDNIGDEDTANPDEEVVDPYTLQPIRNNDPRLRK